MLQSRFNPQKYLTLNVCITVILVSDTLLYIVVILHFHYFITWYWLTVRMSTIEALILCFDLYLECCLLECDVYFSSEFHLLRKIQPLFAVPYIEMSSLTGPKLMGQDMSQKVWLFAKVISLSSLLLCSCYMFVGGFMSWTRVKVGVLKILETLRGLCNN